MAAIVMAAFSVAVRTADPMTARSPTRVRSIDDERRHSEERDEKSEVFFEFGFHNFVP